MYTDKDSPSSSLYWTYERINEGCPVHTVLLCSATRTFRFKTKGATSCSQFHNLSEVSKVSVYVHISGCQSWNKKYCYSYEVWAGLLGLLDTSTEERGTKTRRHNNASYRVTGSTSNFFEQMRDLQYK
jgi:hypothetical protein